MVKRSDFNIAIHQILGTQKGMYLNYLDSKRVFKDQITEYMQYFRLFIEEGNADELFDQIKEHNSIRSTYDFNDKRRFNLTSDEAYALGQENTFQRMLAEFSKIKEDLYGIDEQTRLQSSKLNQGDVAGICHYLGIPVTKGNQQEIAHRFNLKGKGQGIYNDYCKWASYADRTGDPGTKKKYQNKISRFNRIIDFITKEQGDEDGLNSASKDLEKLMENVGNAYD